MILVPSAKVEEGTNAGIYADGEDGLVHE